MDRVSIKDLKWFEINREVNHREIDRDFQENQDYQNVPNVANQMRVSIVHQSER